MFISLQMRPGQRERNKPTSQQRTILFTFSPRLFSLSFLRINNRINCARRALTHFVFAHESRLFQSDDATNSALAAVDRATHRLHSRATDRSHLARRTLRAALLSAELSRSSLPAGHLRDARGARPMDRRRTAQAISRRCHRICTAIVPFTHLVMC